MLPHPVEIVLKGDENEELVLKREIASNGATHVFEANADKDLLVSFRPKGYKWSQELSLLSSGQGG